MELVQLFDEERIITGKEQRRKSDESKGELPGYYITWADTFFRRVRLFKAEAVFKKNRDEKGGSQELPLYLLIEDDYDWIGEDPRWPIARQRRRTYVTGTDSTRIRQAVKIADGFGGKVNR